MPTADLRTPDPLSVMRELAQTDFDTVEAYEVALDRLKDPELVEQMRSFREDHRNHIGSFNLLIQDLGGKPVLTGDVKHLLTEGRVFLGSLFGDRSILKAMRGNELDIAKAYENVAHDKSLPFDILRMIRVFLEETRRHLKWFDEVLASHTRRVTAN